MLFLHGEDFAAIQTVAAAARTIVKDLADAKGIAHLLTRETLEQMLRDALAAVGRSSETGDALEEFQCKTLAWAVAAANRGVIPGKVRFELDDLDPTNPKIAAAIDQEARTIEGRKETKEYRNKATNFLKHADYKYAGKHPDESLKLSDLNVFGILVEAIDLWMKMNLPRTAEMDVYSIWFCAVTAEKPEDFIITKGGPVHLFTFEQQIDFGGFMLKSVLRKMRRSTKQFRDDTVYRPGDVKMYCALA